MRVLKTYAIAIASSFARRAEGEPCAPLIHPHLFPQRSPRWPAKSYSYIEWELRVPRPARGCCSVQWPRGLLQSPLDMSHSLVVSPRCADAH